MATDVTGSPVAVGEPSQQGNDRTASAAQGQRKPRNRRNQPHSILQLDGTVSDSMAMPQAPARSVKTPKQRQSVAMGAVPAAHIGQMPQANGSMPRSASLSTNILGATPEKQQAAYAGPTFHASPAPSSLPVPRFFSRSVPNVAKQPSLQARMEGDQTPEKESSSPESDAVSPLAARASEQSPLDIFFQADMAEKEKRRSSGALLSPVSVARALNVPATEPVQRHANPFSGTSKSIFIRELDGGHDDMPSPRIIPQSVPSMPRARSSPGNVPQVETGNDDRAAYTKSLKDLLFNNVPSTPSANATPASTQDRAVFSPQFHDLSISGPSPFHQGSSGPSTPQPSSADQRHYSLHYGNRNLSPLFKAARAETPTRPSSLRQELTSGAVSDSAAIDSAARHNGAHPRTTSQQQDAATISRNYLKQHIQAAESASRMPQIPFDTAAIDSGYSESAVSPRGVPTSPSSSESPRMGGIRDVSSMEDDLRRMLNLGGVKG